MKLLLITAFLRNKNNKLKKGIYNNKVFNKLFNDYTLRNKKKENMKINYLRNESELYPFSPKVDKNIFITFSPKSGKRNYKEPIFSNYGRTFYNSDKVPLNQKINYFFTPYNKNGRNRNNDNEYFNGNNKNQYFNNFSENDKNHDYMQYDFFGNKKANPINLKESSYRFPGNKKNIYSSLNSNINKQISEYLNNFENAKMKNIIPKNNNLNNNYLNYNRDSNKNKTQRSKFSFNKDSFYSVNNRNNRNNIRESLFNKNNKIGYKNQTERFSFIKNPKSKPAFKINNEKKIEYKNRNKKNNNNKIINNNSENYLNNLSKKNNNPENELNVKDKNTLSNKSLNPLSLGSDQTKTFYTNNQRNSNNIKFGNNINSISSRINEPNTHFLTGLKMISGVNECFYDISKVNNKNNHRDELSIQSLSDSKMMELANRYLSEDETSSENYKMNNIIHSKKKHKNKK
jgi:hypothetical protein